jgi:hypothetical protein
MGLAIVRCNPDAPGQLRTFLENFTRTRATDRIFDICFATCLETFCAISNPRTPRVLACSVAGSRFSRPFRSGIGPRQRSLGRPDSSAIRSVHIQPDPDWGSSCSIPGNTLPPKEILSSNTNSQHPDSSSACLIATKPRRYWAFTRRRFNAWLVRENFPAFKSAICGVSEPRL